MPLSRTHLQPSQVLLHPSEVNRLTETYDGIDVCGMRLAQEIRSVVAAHPKLERISVVGHSMGGLLLRYAIGVLYDPEDSSIAGLQPCHFVSMATPHMGCDAEGLAQVRVSYTLVMGGWTRVWGVPPVSA